MCRIAHVGLVVGLVAAGAPAWADTLQVTEYQVTDSTARETTPTLGSALGHDGATELVVYTVKPWIDGELGAGDIWYQRLVDGSPVGPAVQVTNALTDDQLNDVSGDFIVYTAYASTGSAVGTIMLYEISTATLQQLGSADIIQEPRIHDDYVVWREGGAFAARVMLYDMGLGGSALTLAGPTPPTFDVQIGSSFVVWAEWRDSEHQFDIAAYNLRDGTTYAVTDSVGTNDRFPATSGSWVVWQAANVAEMLVSRIEAINLDTGEHIVVVDDGAGNRNPSIDGDLIAWESDATGNLEIYVYRISTGETFQVTNDPNDQYLNDVHGDLVAYVDQRLGSEDVFVSSLEFIPPDPCAELGGDTDGDGVCNDLDNCPTVANFDQADMDEDGVGDACDEPPAECPMALDFDLDPSGDTVFAGTIVTEEWAADGIHVNCSNNHASHPDACLIFDSSSPTGGDYDLGTPHQDFGGPGVGHGGAAGRSGENADSLFNLVVVAEDIEDQDGDGLADDPDDEAAGGEVRMTFDQPVDIATVKVIDIDMDEPGSAVLVVTDAGGAVIDIPIPVLGDNSVQEVEVFAPFAIELTVAFVSSGGLAEVVYCPSMMGVAKSGVAKSGGSDVPMPAHTAATFETITPSHSAGCSTVPVSWAFPALLPFLFWRRRR
ncbi:hypothetical protein ACFL6C_00115 [Myxococcota bacterium]